ncbi:menin [Lingula anatina]|uniref:Menin n=1 Tax=Lingula anatina TaxID=7574 RepID=A0A1S3ITE6_LINAN|nr:menin [Lingula anatina]|eukprot:XP_013401358.1 menin [Lingula anatina]
MAGFRDRDKQHFPLQSIESVVRLFRDQLHCTDEPNLALLSIIIGSIEHTLTVNRALPQNVDLSKTLEPIFPIIDLQTVEALYCRFESLIRGSVDLTQFPAGKTTRQLIKRVSDVVWNSLSRSYYKDKAHLQTLYSLLTGNKLDCFGLAYSVVAACQVLGLTDVHLALSEDHAWVVFGENGEETAEVTWHGKGNEDKRGQSISMGVAEKSWLYLNGHPVVCDRKLEVASLVSGINCSINASTDSVELGDLQQELLWLLYDMGFLKRYPMALGNLGDLEEIQPTSGRPTPIELFKEAIDTARTYYDNHHVYPYTYMAAYMYRKKHYKEALKYWADAASVIKRFNYNREDEEIYKEFLEIANDMIPNIVRAVTSAETQSKPRLEDAAVVIAAPSVSQYNQTHILHDPDCYSYLLQFYDGICQWEEGSSTPVLHVGWAQQLVYTLSRFDPKVRENMEVHAEGERDGEDEEEEDDEDDDDEEDDEEAEEKAVGDKVKSERVSSVAKELVGESKVLKRGRGRPKKAPTNAVNGGGEVRNNQEKAKFPEQSEEDKKEEQIKSTIEELASKVGEGSQNETPNPNIAALAQACGESILNPDYLLGSGEPFNSEAKVEISEFLSSKTNSSPFAGMTMDSMLKAESPADFKLFKGMIRPASARSQRETPISGLTAAANGQHGLVLHSEKMKGLKSLLTATKMNASAIKLQLTAQSQVHLKHTSKRGFDVEVGGARPKRTRRE